MPRRLSAPFRNESRRIRRGRGQPLVFALLKGTRAWGRHLRARWNELLLTSPHCLMHGSSGAIRIAALKVSTSRPARPGKPTSPSTVTGDFGKRVTQTLTQRQQTCACNSRFDTREESFSSARSMYAWKCDTSPRSRQNHA